MVVVGALGVEGGVMGDGVVAWEKGLCCLASWAMGLVGEGIGGGSLRSGDV